MADFATKNGLELQLPSKQNYYPDLTFVDEWGNKFAVDFKSSYYEDNKEWIDSRLILGLF